MTRSAERFSISKAYVLPLSFLFFLSSCGKLNLSLSGISTESTTFLGIAPKFQGLITKESKSFVTSAYASSCSATDTSAELYLLTSSGATENTPLARTILRGDGSFEFDFKKLGLSLGNSIDYTVKVAGCDLVFTAPVLILGEKQIIDSRSTFVAASVNSDAPIKLKNVSREAARSLITKLSGETVEEVRANIILNAPATSQYNQIFGTTPTVVDVAPVVGLSAPKNKIPEDQAHLFAPVVEKLDSGYSAVYEWKLDGVVVASTLNWSYHPGKNDQGVHTISLRVGANDGSGNIDSIRPFYSKTFSVTVDNTFFPIAPTLILANAFVNNTIVMANFNKSDCSTFSKVAITTVATPSTSDFIYTCADSNIPVSISAGDGLKTIYIHSQDQHGDISARSSESVTLDTVAPTLSSASTLLVGGLVFSGLRDELVTYIAADMNLGTNPMSFEYSTDSGASWIGIAQNLASAGSYLWNLPNIDSNLVRFRIVARDLAGNTSILASASNFTIDSTPPTILNATLSVTHTNSSLIKATVASCLSDQAYMLMNESATTPLVGDSGWSPCSTASTALTHNLINMTNGPKTLYLWSKDLAGNISASATRTIVYDSTPPVIALTSPANNFFINDSNKGSVSFVGTCSENGVINVSGALTATLTCSSGSFSQLLSFSGVPDGDLLVTLNQTDLAGNSATAVSVILKKDTGIPNLAITAPASASFVNLANQSSFTLSGNCSEEGRDVVISGAVSTTTPCSSGTFSATLDLTPSPQGSLTLTVNHSDLVGNNAPASSRSFTKDTIAPLITQSTFVNGSYKNTNSVIFGGACETGSIVAVTGSDSASSTCVGSSWAYSTQTQSSDGAYSYIFTHTDPAGNSSTVNANWIRETTLPQVQSVLIAEGAEYVGTSFVVVDVEATDNVSVMSVRIKNAHVATKDCQSEYANDSWQAYSSGVQRYSISIPPGDGEKKICVWAKDHAGNVSIVTPELGTLGVDMDTVRYEIGNPPQVIAFDVKNASNGTSFSLNQDVTISWSVTDQEELSENPISLWYTTNSGAGANWNEIVLNYGNIGNGQKTYTDSFTTFKAPSAGVFKVKIMTRDSAGNTSLTSERVLNTGNWSIFAGSTDSGAGGSALGIRLKFTSANSFGQYATIDPVTNDAYVVSYGEGIYKLDAVTGKTEVFIKHGVRNIVDGGVINSSTALSATHLRILFDKTGLLYIMEPSGGDYTREGIIWQINPRTKAVKKYLGGGNVNNDTASASTAHVQYSFFTFDESNSIYYTTSCSPGSAYIYPSLIGLRLMKATQNITTKVVETITTVAGDCTVGSPTAGAGVNSLNRPLTESGYLSMGGIAAWDNGNKIYYRLHGASGYKIVNGTTYKSNLSFNPYYDHDNQILYFGQDSVRKINLNLTGSNGDTSTVYVEAAGVGECLKDGVSRLSSCVSTIAFPIRGPNGKVAFLDGIISNANSTYAVRYVDDEENVRTYLGTPPFYGDGLDKSFLNSYIGGIYYKKNYEPNQAAFPEGLYFVDGSAMVMGRVELNGIVQLIAGNQSRKAVSASTGETFNKLLSLGTPYGAGKLMSSLAFNNEGLPYMKVTSVSKSLMKVEANKTITFKTGSVTSNYFDMAQTADNPSAFGLYVFGGANNLVLKDEQKLFVLGAYIHPTDRSGILSGEMKLFDYGSETGVTHIMGDKTKSPIFSADDATGGNLSSKRFSSQCQSSATCFLQYHEDQDRIYFSEGTNLRYITTPEIPATSTLGTLFTASRTIYNFIFSEDGKQVFYLSSDGRLYCKDISSGKAWCNDTLLGPTTGMSVISPGPNQLTWKSANILLISTYTGMIYQYNLLP